MPPLRYDWISTPQPPDKGDIMKLIDRDFLRFILETLAGPYPDRVFTPDLVRGPDDHALLVRHLTYLTQHGLITMNIPHKARGAGVPQGYAELTADGLDFLADDGGLSATLGTVVVKLHADTLKDLLQMRIQAADLPHAEKQRYLEALQALPAETTKHLVLKLVDLGLENVQKVFPLLQTFL